MPTPPPPQLFLFTRLENTTTKHVIAPIKSIFAKHGIPVVASSDNRPQFDGYEFKHFAKEYGFTHTMSSTRYPQPNGHVENDVKIKERLLNKAEVSARSLYVITKL